MRAETASVGARDTVQAAEIASARKAMIYVAWGQALIATVGSLFFSEVLGYVPCSLCWYQRILMYPLVIVLAVGILRRDVRVRSYVLPLSLLGFVIALYHNLLYFGFIPENAIQTCTTGASCSTRWFEWFGFISIPQLSLVAFTVITVAMLWHWSSDSDEQATDDVTEESVPAFPEPRLYDTKTIAVTVGVSSLLAGILMLGMMKNLSDTTDVSPPEAASTPAAGVVTPLPPLRDDATVADSQLIGEGLAVFSRQCVACHGANARGVSNLGPNLVGNGFIRSSSDDELRRLITSGRLREDPMNRTGLSMPPKGGNPTLTDRDIAALTAYLRSLDGN